MITTVSNNIDLQVIRQWFAVGKWGEIIPPHLGMSDSLDSDQYEKLMLEIAARHVGGDVVPPTRGRSRTGYDNLVAVFVHEQRMEALLSGATAGSHEELILRMAVMGGIPLSLAPIAIPTRNYRTFAPVLRRIEGDAWSVGVRSVGRWKKVEAESGGVAYQLAKQATVAWGGEEDVNRAQWLRAQTKSIPANPWVYQWAFQLDTEGVVSPKSNIRVEKWGNHSSYALYTNEGMTPFKAFTSLLAAKQLYALMGHLPPPPTVDETITSLLSGVVMTTVAGNLFVAGNVSVSVGASGRLEASNGTNSLVARIVSTQNESKAIVVDTASDKKNPIYFAFPNHPDWREEHQLKKVVSAWLISELR